MIADGDLAAVGDEDFHDVNCIRSRGSGAVTVSANALHGSHELSHFDLDVPDATRLDCSCVL